MTEQALPIEQFAAQELQRMRMAGRHLPSELAHKPLLKWPTAAAALTSIPEGVLRNRQEVGDAPRLVYVGRQAFVRPKDLHAWIDAHVFDPGREPARGRRKRGQHAAEPVTPP